MKNICYAVGLGFAYGVLLVAGCSKKHVSAECQLRTVENCTACGDNCLVGEHITAAVCEFAGPSCRITACEPGWHDVDGDAANGCEYLCTTTAPGPEICDNQDNDCDGTVDNPGAGGCTTYYLDADRDGHGKASDSRCSCVAQAPYDVLTLDDCDDALATCSIDCTDVDADGTPDCGDVCLDADGDGYGVAGGAGNTCNGPDCNDVGSPTCTTDCVTDADADGTPDCADTCLDADGDNYGLAGGAGDTCTGADCNDVNSPSCTTDCVTDVDADGIPDCADTCLDADGDGYGDPGGAGNTCLGADCDDRPTFGVHCALSCSDNDFDTWCVDNDCRDDNNACNADCSSSNCKPAYLLLSGQTPRSLCQSSTLSINLDRVVGFAADISCAGTAQTLHALADFENTDLGGWSDWLGTTFGAWQDGFPGTCPSSGAFLKFLASQANSYDRLNVTLNATGYQKITLTFVAAYKNVSVAGDSLSVEACCGAGCTLAAVGNVPNTFGAGGTNGCGVTRSVVLPDTVDDCAALRIGFSWPNTVADAAVDDLTVTGEPLFGAVVDEGGGYYSTTLTSCVKATQSITCTWDDSVNPPVSNNTPASIDFQ